MAAGALSIVPASGVDREFINRDVIGKREPISAVRREKSALTTLDPDARARRARSARSASKQHALQIGVHHRQRGVSDSTPRASLQRPESTCTCRTTTDVAFAHIPRSRGVSGVSLELSDIYRLSRILIWLSST